MNVLCEQPRFLTVHARLVKELREMQGIEGDLFFLGISGRLDGVMGSDILPFKEHVEKSQGIVLYLHDVRFKNDTARQFTDNIKYFIDGIEHNLGKHVLIVGCPVDQQRSGERWILNESRWPERKAENVAETISTSETEELS